MITLLGGCGKPLIIVDGFLFFIVVLGLLWMGRGVVGFAVDSLNPVVACSCLFFVVGYRQFSLRMNKRYLILTERVAL